MNIIFYTKTFQEKISDAPQKDVIYKKLEDLKYVEKPETLNSVDKYPKGLLVLKFLRAHLCRIIIEPRYVEVNRERVYVFFVRDFVSKKSFDYYWGGIIHPQLMNGQWLQQNPLNEDEVFEFKKEYLISKMTGGTQLPPLPVEMSQSLEDIKLTLKFDVYERQDWVLFANDRTKNGLHDKYLLLFKDTLKQILNGPQKKKSTVEIKVINKAASIYQAVNTEYGTGIIYSDLIINGERKILLHNGAHTLTQKSRWNEALTKAAQPESVVESTQLSIAKDAFRAYPKWIVLSDSDHEDLWSAIQSYEGSHNLSLLPEQIDFLSTSKFPTYINGQAGSGKSTMLYYLFANVILYKYSNAFNGDIIFLTENDHLLEHTIKSVIGLLRSNPEYSANFSVEELSGARKYFSSFKNFLLNIVPEEERNKFSPGKFLDFAKFKELYNVNYNLRKYSAEESWFALSTYVFGYDEEKIIDSANEYEKIPSKFRIIDTDRFVRILENVLPFYNKLIKEEFYWDRVTIVRQIWKFFPKMLPKQYYVVFCDEAQDFTRIELRLILRSSEFTNYDLSKTDQVPIVLAGDALQTVSPTGFSDTRLHQMFFDLFSENHFNYSKKKSTYNPEYNYRSVLPIVRLANVVQNFRKEGLDEDVTVRQSPKRSEKITQPPILHYKSWLLQPGNRQLFETKFKYKSFIVPIDLNEEGAYEKKEDLLNGKFKDIKSSVDAKGAEYSQVVVYGFGEHYLKEFGKLSWKGNGNDFQKQFFFNKLYVAITRAQNELVIVDTEEAAENFWKQLILIPSDVRDKWEAYSDVEEILLSNPETGLQEIKQSTPEDALANAIKDMEQGIADNNSARLRVASDVFIMLDELGKANECLGHRDIIKNKWDSAGHHFLKAQKLDEAANAFFQGKQWTSLNSKFKTLAGNKQAVRILVSRLMTNGVWTKEELKRIYELRNELGEVIYGVNWYGEFNEQIKQFAKILTSSETRRELAFILEGIATDSDTPLWEIIGDLYFNIKQFDQAISAWNKYLNPQKNPQYFPNYIIAHIEKATDESDIHDQLLWTGRLIQLEISNGERIKKSKEFLDLLLKNPGVIENSVVKPELNAHLYLAKILIGELQDLSLIGNTVERQVNDPLALINFYDFAITHCTSEEFCMFLKERWIITVAKLKGYFQNVNNAELLKQINSEFSKRNFPFPDSNFEISPEEIAEISEFPEVISSEPNPHYKNITIRNFRRFGKIEVKNVGRFNLILGDNNSGKTTLLEGLLFSSDPQKCLLNFLYATKQRGTNLEKEGTGQFLENYFNKSSDNKQIEFVLGSGRRFWAYIVRTPSPQEVFEFLKIETSNPRSYISIKKLSGPLKLSDRIENCLSDIEKPDILKNIPFIPFGKGYFEKLASIYMSEVNTKALRERFIAQMKLFIPGIIDIQPDTKSNTIQIEEGRGTGTIVLPLSDYGEGANKLFRILVQLHAAKGGRLMIDEVDAGIHYSRFKEFWKLILKTARDFDVQLFATSHNQECIKYFWEILNESQWSKLEEGDINFYKLNSRFITLDRNVKTSEIVPIVRDFENVNYAYEHDLELRGGE